MRLLLAISLSICAYAAPCITGTPACTERVPAGPAGRYTLVYRSFPLTAPNPTIERALIVVHGQGRNADNYFESMMAAAFLGRALDSTLVISPRFASRDGNCRDRLEQGEISWGCGGARRWAVGGDAADGSNVTSFDFTDRLLQSLTNKALFPNLKLIVVTGHSAGGQFVNRYAATSHAKLSVPVRYVVSNPSSYLYFDDTRLKGDCTAKGECNGEFSPFGEGKSCAAFNDWGYGLAKRSGYSKRISIEELRANTITRDVVYLLGELDTIPVAGFDSSCPAMAQGKSRLDRGVTYWNYVNKKLGAKHSLEIVPACGHNGRCMFTSDTGVRTLFQ
jgi:hypothetical protein